jgi:hypothetical protein
MIAIPDSVEITKCGRLVVGGRNGKHLSSIAYRLSFRIESHREGE